MKKPQIISNQNGFMLLEALIGILIFSMGILAIVGLQAASIKNSADAKYRTDASFLANQIVSQMWVDRANVASYAYGGTGTIPAKLTNWANSVQNTLPGASTKLPIIKTEAIGASLSWQVTVTIFWKEPQETSTHKFTATAYINK